VFVLLAAPFWHSINCLLLGLSLVEKFVCYCVKCYLCAHVQVSGSLAFLFQFLFLFLSSLFRFFRHRLSLSFSSRQRIIFACHRWLTPSISLSHWWPQKSRRKISEAAGKWRMCNFPNDHWMTVRFARFIVLGGEMSWMTRTFRVASIVTIIQRLQGKLLDLF